MNEFYKDNHHHSGLYRYCKGCHLKLIDSYHKEHREYYTQLEKRRYHRQQNEAGCHLKPRSFYPGFRFLEAFQNAKAVEVAG